MEAGERRSGEMTFYVVRHGQTLFNVMGKVQGWCDTPLTDEGVRAAQSLGRGLAEVDFSAAYSSDSGRAVRLGLNGQSVDASDLRIALGSTKMRSTLITSLRAQEGKLVMAGTGYGHGVGMSQWGAYGMAQAGSTAEEIVTYYFKDVSIEKLW